MVKRVVGLSAKGKRVGEDNPRAVLTDHDVQLLLALHQEGYGYAKLARMFEVAKSSVQSIITGRTRGKTVQRYRTVRTRAE